MNASNPETNYSSEPVSAEAVIESNMAQNPSQRRRFFQGLLYWFKLVLQPVTAVAFVIAMAFGFGYAQRNFDWFDSAKSSVANENAESDTLYACSMLCVFVKAPGRCPVCGMELQEIEVPGDPKDIFGVTIDPTARRLANIKTVTALNMPIAGEIEVLGKITYDETTEATISSYVDGRIEDLLVDYTGATVRKGDALAVLYSPDLYADQVGLLSAKKALQENRSGSERVQQSNQRLYESARRRLAEFGIPDVEIDAIETRNKPNSQVRIFAPNSGTVVAKLVDEGKYVKTGMPILKIADLSKVWLKLEMYPEDTNDLKIGQTVTVSIQSQVGKKFEGQISFIDPMVDPKTQAVSVRVVISNEAGLIKIGDFGKALIQKSVGSSDMLVVVPRESVLMNGSDSVAYVETEQGRFEFRKVEIAEIMGDKIAIASGIEPGEQVVASGVFMLDSTFNIQGKVSLIDPNRIALKDESKLATDKSESKKTEAEAKEIEESFSGLSAEDRQLSESQVICPVTEVKLGTMGMGAPINVDVNGTPIMICCEGCRKNLLNDPEKYFEILDAYHKDKSKTPAKATTSNSSPAEMPQMELPKMELPQMELPQMELPQMELPKLEAPKR